MWTVSPLPGSFAERRKGQRRSGIGRRIHGERRAAEVPPQPDELPPGWKRRAGERRKQARRVLQDRRSGQAEAASSLPS
jgi:hypothetical protein